MPRESVGSCSSDSSTTTRWSGVSSGSRSTSGLPMLPPRIAGWASSVARSAWVRADVVVLPFVPVIPIVGAGHSRRKRSTSDSDRRRRLVAAGPSVDDGSQRRPQPRFCRRVVGVDGRRAGDQRGAGERHRPARRPDPAAVARPDRPAPRWPAPARRRARVVDRHRRPGVVQESRQRDAGSGKAQDRDRTVAEQAGAQGARDQLRRVDRPLGRHDTHCSRSMEARNSVTPISPAMIPMIQNRSVIFSSSQPISS